MATADVDTLAPLTVQHATTIHDAAGCYVDERFGVFHALSAATLSRAFRPNQSEGGPETGGTLEEADPDEADDDLDDDDFDELDDDEFEDDLDDDDLDELDDDEFEDDELEDDEPTESDAGNHNHDA